MNKEDYKNELDRIQASSQLKQRIVQQYVQEQEQKRPCRIMRWSAALSALVLAVTIGSLWMVLRSGKEEPMGKEKNTPATAPAEQISDKQQPENNGNLKIQVFPVYKEGKTQITRLSVQIENLSDEDVNFTQQYLLQYHRGDYWINVPSLLDEGIIINDVNLEPVVIKAGEEKTMDLNLSRQYLTPDNVTCGNTMPDEIVLQKGGTYRVIFFPMPEMSSNCLSSEPFRVESINGASDIQPFAANPDLTDRYVSMTKGEDGRVMMNISFKNEGNSTISAGYDFQIYQKSNYTGGYSPMEGFVWKDLAVLVEPGQTWEDSFELVRYMDESSVTGNNTSEIRGDDLFSETGFTAGSYLVTKTVGSNEFVIGEFELTDEFCQSHTKN